MYVINARRRAAGELGSGWGNACAGARTMGYAPETTFCDVHDSRARSRSAAVCTGNARAKYCATTGIKCACAREESECARRGTVQGGACGVRARVGGEIGGDPTLSGESSGL